MSTKATEEKWIPRLDSESMMPLEMQTPKGRVLPLMVMSRNAHTDKWCKDRPCKVNGHWTTSYTNYLQVAHRVVWFREEHPVWTIVTALAEDHGNESCVMRATILDENGREIATAIKQESKSDFADFREKAETGAIGRALALCGYGTAFAPEFDEGERIADSPMPATRKAEAKTSGGNTKPNGGAPASAGEEATEKQRHLMMSLMREKHGFEKGDVDGIRSTLALILKRTVASSKEITKREATAAIKHLQALPKYEDAVRKAQDEEAEAAHNEPPVCPSCESTDLGVETNADARETIYTCIDCDETWTVADDSDLDVLEDAPEPEAPKPAKNKPGGSGRAGANEDKEVASTPPAAAPSGAITAMMQRLVDAAKKVNRLTKDGDIHLSGPLAMRMGRDDGMYHPRSFDALDCQKLIDAMERSK